MTNFIKEITGKNMNARIVPARGIEGKLGEFEVKYEYSRRNGTYLYHTNKNTGSRKTFATLALATAAAKRIAW